jgi:hydroxyacylglutathione hydrolase
MGYKKISGVIKSVVFHTLLKLCYNEIIKCYEGVKGMEIKCYEDIYILDDGKVREFLIIGEDKALLIDTGFEYDHIYDEVKKITQKPIQVVLTHGDRDHCGGVESFECCYIHPDDSDLISDQTIIKKITAGDCIQIGQYTFEIIEIPGHTPGSIGLLDRKRQLLIGGDSIQVGPIYMFGKHRSLDTYIESLQKLIKEKDDIEVILPSHHRYPLTKDYIDYCLEDALALKNGQLPKKPHQTLPCYEYQGKYVQFYYD